MSFPHFHCSINSTNVTHDPPKPPSISSQGNGSHAPLDAPQPPTWRGLRTCYPSFFRVFFRRVVARLGMFSMPATVQKVAVSPSGGMREGQPVSVLRCSLCQVFSHAPSYSRWQPSLYAVSPYYSVLCATNQNLSSCVRCTRVKGLPSVATCSTSCSS